MQHKTELKTEKSCLGNSLDKLHHPRSDAYSAEQVLLNKRQILGVRSLPQLLP